MLFLTPIQQCQSTEGSKHIPANNMVFSYAVNRASCDQVVCVPDVTSIYRVPLILEDQKVVEFFASRLHLPLPTPRPRKFLMKWRDLADR